MMLVSRQKTREAVRLTVSWKISINFTRFSSEERPRGAYEKKSRYVCYNNANRLAIACRREKL